MKDYELVTEDFSFAAIATLLTGRVFAPDEFDKLARFLARDSPNQVMADRKHKWIPWLLVQFPFLVKLDFSKLEETNALEWLERNEQSYRGPYTVKAVHFHRTF